jgi:hypothetical protein
MTYRHTYTSVWDEGDVHIGFLWGNLKERDHLEDLVVYRRISKRIFKNWDGGMSWINLALDRDK